MVKKLLFVMAAILVITFVGRAADVTGKWVAQVAGRNGATQEVAFNLKVDGGTLTGTVTGGGGGGRRGGGGGGGAAATPREISDAKIDGDKISFSVKAEFNGQTRVTSYSGTVEGDTLKLKQTREGRNGAQTTDITAKRSTT
jgi:hypothetical protein